MMCEHDTKPFNHHRPSSQPLEHKGPSQRRLPGQMGMLCPLNRQLETGGGLCGIHYGGRWYADEPRISDFHNNKHYLGISS